MRFGLRVVEEGDMSVAYDKLCLSLSVSSFAGIWIVYSMVLEEFCYQQC